MITRHGPYGAGHRESIILLVTQDGEGGMLFLGDVLTYKYLVRVTQALARTNLSFRKVIAELGAEKPCNIHLNLIYDPYY